MKMYKPGTLLVDVRESIVLIYKLDEVQGEALFNNQFYYASASPLKSKIFKDDLYYIMEKDWRIV